MMVAKRKSIVPYCHGDDVDLVKATLAADGSAGTAVCCDHPV